MEMEPQSEYGKKLLAVLENWMDQSAETAKIDKLQRVLIFHSPEIQNVDAFISCLYGQSVLDESPLTLSQQVPTTLLRVQHALEISLSKRCLKQLIVAYERSGNNKVLMETTNWAEKNLNKDEDKGPSSDLAPQSFHKRKLFTALKGDCDHPRYRKINWIGEHKFLSVMEVCRTKIIAGFTSGEIEVFRSTDLRCLTVLNYCKSKGGVTCLQCTCTEIIAGYGDGTIFIWDIEKATLLRTLHIRIGNDVQDDDYASSMRWRSPRLVVASGKGRVKIWQYVSSSVALLGTWNDVDRSVLEVDCNEKYVTVRPFLVNPTLFRVNQFSGEEHRVISVQRVILSMALYDHYAVTADADKVITLWDISSGARLRDLKAHENRICALHAHDGVFASGDQAGKVIIWSFQEALDGRPAKLATLTRPTSPEIACMKLGSNFLATGSLSPSNAIEVTDFAP